MNDILLTNLSRSELVEEILEGVKILLDSKSDISKNCTIHWTASETANHLRISKVTLHDYTMKGLLTKYKIGARIFYKKDEVLAAIKKMEY